MGDDGVAVDVDSKAYKQIYLHAAKYPSLNIVGFLLGTHLPNGEVVVQDLLPVCHSYPTATVLEIGALVAETIGKSCSMKVLGVYFANEIVSDNQVPNYVTQIASTISANMDFCVVCQVRNDFLSKRDTSFLQVVYPSNLKGKLKLNDGKNLGEINQTLDKLISKGIQFKFSDFEDHMNDNGESDFRNAAIEFD